VKAQGLSVLILSEGKPTLAQLPGDFNEKVFRVAQRLPSMKYN
jgi:hypothetical protein